MTSPRTGLPSMIDHTRPEVGETVSCMKGVPATWGHPSGRVVSLGPVNVMVELCDGSGVRPIPRDGIDRSDLRCSPLVIVPCGGKKLDQAARAGDLYVGSYHLACRRAADRISKKQLILSAKHGLVTLDTIIEPYDLRMGDPGCVSVETVREQARHWRLHTESFVHALGGRAYTDVVTTVWPRAKVPLAGCAGIGEQLARLARLAA